MAPAQTDGKVATDDLLEKELIDLSERLMKAVEEKDRATLESLVGDEFMLESPGYPDEGVPKSEWITNAIEMDWTDLRFHDFKIRSFGETAVITSRLDFNVKTKAGIPMSSDAQIMDVWVQRDGRWQIASRNLGAYSIEGKIKFAIGLVVGLLLWLLVWAIRKIRRSIARKRATVAPSA